MKELLEDLICTLKSIVSYKIVHPKTTYEDFHYKMGNYSFVYFDHIIIVSINNIQVLSIHCDTPAARQFRMNRVQISNSSIVSINKRLDNEIVVSDHNSSYNASEILESEESYFQHSTLIELCDYDKLNEIVEFIKYVVTKDVLVNVYTDIDDLYEIPFSNYGEHISRVIARG